MRLTLAAMTNEPNPLEPDVTDHQEIQQSLKRLDRSTSWFKWNTVLMIGLLVAALAVLIVPELLGQNGLPQQMDISLIVGVLLVIMMVGNSYTLFHQRHFKLFRTRLAEQMQVAIKQRIRADKFYGMAILDPLTGLYNRRFGEECLQREIARAERTTGDLAVIVLDLDYFSGNQRRVRTRSGRSGVAGIFEASAKGRSRVRCSGPHRWRRISGGAAGMPKRERAHNSVAP